MMRPTSRRWQDYPATPPPGTALCSASEIKEGEARSFEFRDGPDRFELFVIRKGGRLRAYVNDCPHAHTPLDWTPNRFFDRKGQHLMCATHGALFRPADGKCISGPCLNERLTSVPLEEDIDGMLRIRRPQGRLIPG